MEYTPTRKPIFPLFIEVFICTYQVSQAFTQILYLPVKTQRFRLRERKVEPVEIGGIPVKGKPLTLLVGMQTSTPLWRTVWRFLKKLEIELPYDPAIPLVGIHTKETRPERDTCTPTFIAALFIIARMWKQPRCPSADEWIRKQWYIYTMEY